MRFELKRGATLLALAVSAALAFADGSAKSITLEQAVQEAKASNLTLRGEALKSDIKKRDQDLAYNRLYPSLSAGAGIVDLNDTRPNKRMVGYYGGENVYMTPDALNLGLQLSAQFVFSASVMAAIDQTKIDYANSRISYALAAQRLERDVRKSFYQLLVLQETMRVTERQLNNAEQRYKEALANARAGQASDLTVLQAKVAWENRKPGLDDLKVSYGQLLFGFENLLGREPDPDLLISGSLEIAAPDASIDSAEAVNRLVERRLDVQAAEGQIKTVDGYLKLQKTLLYPTFVVQWTADPTLNDPFGSGTSWKSDNWYQKSGALSFMVSMKLDSFIPNSVWDNQRMDLADQGSQARAAASQVRLAARTEAMTLFNKVKKSTAALKSLGENVDSALQAYKLTELAYKTGARSLLEVQDAELQYQVAQLNLINEKQLLNASLLDLETALNTPREEIYGKR